MPEDDHYDYGWVGMTKDDWDEKLWLGITGMTSDDYGWLGMSRDE